MQHAKIFAGNSNPALAKSVTEYLETPLGKAEVGKFSDGETGACTDQAAPRNTLARVGQRQSFRKKERVLSHG